MKTLDAHLRESEAAARQHEADLAEAEEMIKNPATVATLDCCYEIGPWSALADAFSAPNIPDKLAALDKIKKLFVDAALKEIRFRRKG